MRLPGVRPSIPFIPQLEATECGAASLAMVMAAYGYHAPIAEVRAACGVSRDGASALAIVRAAQSFGFDATGVKLEAEALAELPLPAIIHWGFSHFVVLERLGRRSATLLDPSSGRIRVSAQEVGRHFTGVAILVAPGEGFRRRAAQRPALGRYRALLKLWAPILGQVLAASLMLQLLGLLFPIANQVLLDRIIGTQQDAWIWALGLGLCGAGLMRAALAWLRGRLLLALRFSMDWVLMGGFLEHLIRLPIGFFLQRRSGDLVDRVQSNAAMRALFTGTSVSALLDGSLLVAYVVLMAGYDLQLGSVIVATALIRLVVRWMMRHEVQRLVSAELSATGREWGVLVETFSAIETIQASGGGGRMLQRWAACLAQRLNYSLQHRRLSLVSEQLAALLQAASLVLVFWLGGGAVLEGRMTIGVLAAFLTLEGAFMRPLESLFTSLGQWEYLKTHLLRLDDVLTTAAEAAGTASDCVPKGGVVFEGVSFRYAPEAPFTLQDVSFEIAAGENVAIVGQAGAGKSTLVRLLLGLLVPEQGRVLIDGQDLREVDLTRLRRRVGVVLQESFLFNDTVRANLSLHDESLSLEQLANAARLACFDDVVEALPDGFDTMVGENGSRLSGGQRQRLCLARALVSDPTILVLDEPASALDLDTEARLQERIGALQCTRIVISHRPALVRGADRILVLQDGRIVERGPAEQAQNPSSDAASAGRGPL